MAEQSHKREMTEAVRGDFERLSARRERRVRAGEGPEAAQPERIVLTPPQRAADEPDTTAEQVSEVPEVVAPLPPERRSWLRALRRG